MIVKHKGPIHGSVVDGIRTHCVLVMVRNKAWPNPLKNPCSREEYQVIEPALQDSVCVFLALATLIVSVDTVVPTITLTVPGFRVFCIIGIILFGNQLLVVPITSIGCM